MPLHEDYLRHVDQNDEELVSALVSYESSSGRNTGALEVYMENNPDSRWIVSLSLNLGYAYYATGYFSKALDSWELAWERSKASTSPSIQRLGQLAVAEYAKMNARIGRKDELDRVFAETAGIQFSDNANVVMQSAVEGRWVMENNPGVAFRCGPYALFNVIECACGEKPSHDLLNEIQSPDTGFSLLEVRQMSRDLGFPMVAAHRSAGAEVVVPSVVHWKVGHYGALVRKEGDHYLLRDPTFGNETWMTREAIDHEASGCFLIPATELPQGWRALSNEDAATVYGKGHSGNGGEPETGPEDPMVGGNPEGCPPGAGMATYSFHTLLASLSIVDTPVGYPTSAGENVYTTVRYNQREYAQPAILNYTNFSPQWVNNWVSFITDNPSIITGNVTLYQRGGGTEIYLGGATTSNDEHGAVVVYTKSVQNQTILRKMDADTYRLDFPDGSYYLYAQEIGEVGTARKVFLSEVVDAFGNKVTLTYDNSLPSRLNKIVDAFGRETELKYEIPDEDYLVSKVVDPFGREAIFNYTEMNSVLRLTSIVDVVGIESSFGYSESFEVNSLTTPYGTTTFELSPFRVSDGYSLIRFIEATDPNGDRERVEMNLSASATGVPYTLDEPTPDSDIVDFAFGDHDDRNSFYWDKQAMRYAEGNYQAAHLYKWVQPGDADSSTSILESEKPALEGRIWYNYPDQPASYIQGSSDRPSVIARLVEGPDGIPVTQAITREYNELGNLTRSVDPLGRETVMEYDGTVSGAVANVDVTAIKVKVGDIWETVSSFSDFVNHLPQTVIDAAGNETSYTYNSYGQILTATNALSEVTTFTYDDFGNLTKIDGPLSGNSDSVEMSYDAFARIRTVTDVDDYTLTYDYDNLDRVTKITYPDATYEEFTYVNLSLDTHRDRLGRLISYTYTPLRQIQSITDTANRTTRFEWCRCGDLRSIFDPMGRQTLWKRDVQGRVTHKQYADGSKIHYQYEPLSGRLSQRIDEEGQITAYAYNVDGTLAQRAYPNAQNPTPSVSFTYDPHYNRALTRTDGIGETAFNYHSVGSLGANRIASIDGPWANDLVEYAYDALNRQIARSINGVPQTLDFDAAGRLESISNALGDFNLAYVGASSRLASVTHNSGIGTEYDYHGVADDLRLKQILNHSTDGSTVISQFDYTQDALDRITAWRQQQGDSSTIKDWTISYDAADQLSSLTDSGSNVASSEWYYDPSGNRLSESIEGATTSFSYNALNQLIESSEDYPETEYEWDAENRLLALIQGTQRTEFTYDGIGRRVRITEKENSSAVSDTTYLWCGMEICEERDATGAVTRKRFFPSGLVDETGQADVSYLYCMDHLGSIRELIETNGAVVETITYDAWGRATYSNPSALSIFSYTGHFSHQLSGLVLAPFRAYDPELGRWISRDPILERDGLNLYTYVGNSPISFNDPLGLEASESKNVFEKLVDFISNVGTGSLGAAAQVTASGMKETFTAVKGSLGRRNTSQELADYLNGKRDDIPCTEALMDQGIY